jgi:hypothetical protein
VTDLNHPYDPDPLAPGTRVRVRPGGECAVWPHHCAPLAHWTGVVSRLSALPELRGHAYWVAALAPPGLDAAGTAADGAESAPPTGLRPAPSAGGWFARAELERLPALLEATHDHA